VLARGADDVLMELLARDAEPLATDHGFIRDYHYDLPLRHFEARRAEEDAARERARARAIEQHRVRRLADAARAVAEMEERRRIKAGWLAMLEHAASLVRGTRHEAALLADLERDMATIGGWSVGVRFPGWLDRGRFEAAFALRLAACEAPG
jgi:hypothetical protein